FFAGRFRTTFFDDLGDRAFRTDFFGDVVSTFTYPVAVFATFFAHVALSFDRITGLPNVEVMTLTEVTRPVLKGRDGALAAVHWRRSHPARIGAPRREFVDEPSLGIADSGRVRRGRKVVLSTVASNERERCVRL